MNYPERLAHAYFFVKGYVISKGFGSEIDWQEGIKYSVLTEQIFLKEAAWVIIASGMNDRVVRKVFPLLCRTMYDFLSISSICQNKSKCFDEALEIFNHKGKIGAILKIALLINELTFEVVKDRIENEGVSFLQTLPYMGQATSFHLAKNIGLDVVKPDRHLVRISTELGFLSPHDMCSVISSKIDEKLSIIDLVLWRYATLNTSYIDHIKFLKSRYS